MKTRRKTETLEEFLARGGSIKFCPPKKEGATPDVVRKTANGGPAVLMTLDEADLFYGEGKVRKKSNKPSNSIDLSALPEALKNKFISKLMDEAEYGEGEED